LTEPRERSGAERYEDDVDELVIR